MTPVEDFTRQRPRVQVDIVTSPGHELLVALWSGKHDDCSNFELGQDWFSELRDDVPDELAAELTELGGDLTAVALVGAVGNHTLDGFLGALETTPSERILELVLDLAYHGDPDTARLAAKGDVDAQAAVLAESEDKVSAVAERLFAAAENGLGERLSRAYRRFYESVEPHLAPFFEAAERSAAGLRGLALALPVEDLIEHATNGVTYTIQPGITRVELAPSVLIRPWSLLTEHGDTLHITYPVGDEYLDADPTAPPGWLVATYKALGDERRLRILKILADGTATLGELSDQLGLAKSTLHHHIGLLRSAGLISVRVDQQKDASVYGLRREIVPEAARLMGRFLAGPDERKSS